MAIDYGERRIGIALSDTEQLIAFPFLTIDTRKNPLYLQKIVQLVLEKKVKKIIIGNPLSIDNKETEKSKDIKIFAGKLAKYLKVPILFWDESLTTHKAIEILHRQKKTIKRNKSKLDMIAASLILKDYLEHS